MSYKIHGKDNLPIKHQGKDVLGSDFETKLIELDEEDMSFLAVGSSEKEDRDKDIIRVSGWDFKNFKKNPVLPWGHNYYEPPVGKASMIKIEEDKKRLVFRAKFDRSDDFAVKIFNKYKGGFLTSFSVGFLPSEWKFRDEDNRWSGGIEFTKQELLEISPVTVPANPDANTLMRSFNPVNGVKNLKQLGYDNCFSRIEKGRFYPVVETEQYTDPVIFPINKDMSIVTAKHLAKKDISVCVGYIFHNDTTTNSEINNWVKENVSQEEKQIIAYIDFKGISTEEEKDIFVLEVVEEEKEKNLVELEEETKDLGEEEAEELEEDIDGEESKNASDENTEENIETGKEVNEENGEENKDLSEKVKNLETVISKLTDIITEQKKEVEKLIELYKDGFSDEKEGGDNSEPDEFLKNLESILSPSPEGNTEEGIEKHQQDEIPLEDVENALKGIKTNEVLESIKIDELLKEVISEFSGKID